MNKFDEIYFKIISEAKSKTDDFDVEKFINSISKSQLLDAAAKVRAKVKKLDQNVTANKRAYDYLLPETLGQDFVNAIVKIMKKNATKEITNKRKFTEDCIIEFLEKRYKNLSIKDEQVIKEAIDMTELQDVIRRELKEEYRDINWSVTFDITENGEESAFESLAEADQDYILSQILEDYTYGTFDEINWSVEFEVTVNCEESSFDELYDDEQKTIVDEIREGYYSGTF